MYIGCFVCVSVYFESRRPLATTISSCGSSVGTFLFGFLYRVSIEYYGWRGALMLLSGLMLNGVVCGTIFRPLAEYADSRNLEHKLSIYYTESEENTIFSRNQTEETILSNTDEKSLSETIFIPADKRKESIEDEPKDPMISEVPRYYGTDVTENTEYCQEGNS